MVITESELRELWRDGKNPIPPFPPGTTFTPAALDFLKSHPIDLTNSPPTAESPVDPSGQPVWDKPGSFPVVLTGPLPVCVECGQPVRHKPDFMTQLDAGHFASKTHPRIKLRGQIDSLHALVMLVAALAREKAMPGLAGYLDTLAAYCREIQSAEYNNRTVGQLVLAGKTAQEIHAASHDPEQYFGIPHLVPGPADPIILHWLNFLRTTAREIEITELEVYPPPARSDLAEAFNRFSSGVYYIELALMAATTESASGPFSSPKGT